jgi:tetratricopeptide (TPR) repeat protein
MCHTQFFRAAALALASILFASHGLAADDFGSCNRSVDNPDEGIKACTRLLEPGRSGVKLPAVYNNRGNAWIRKGLFNNAIEDFTAAIQRDPNFVDAYRNRGLAWHRNGNFDLAIADFNYAIERDSKSAPLYNARGNALLNKGELNRAITDFDKAITIDDRFAAAFNNRGLALQNTRQFDRAIADFNRVISLAPRDPAGYNNRASVWMDKANFSAAIKDYDEAIRLQPGNWRAYSSRGEARRLMGDLDRALADHNEAVKRDRTAVDAYNNRAIVWRDKKDLNRAMTDYDEAILLNPRYDRAYANRGEIWRLKGNFEKSLADLDKALELNPNSVVALTLRGDTHRARGDIERAITDYTEALRILPDAVAAYAGRGLAFEGIGSEVRARSDFQRALSLSADADASLARPAQEIARQRLTALNNAEKARTLAETEQEALRQAAAENARKKQAATEEARKQHEAEEARKKGFAVASDPAVATVPYGRRVALVIGNAGYRNVARLANAAGDADAVANALRETGFQVVMLERDLIRENLIRALRKFEDDVRSADWAVIYYAGHGIEIGGVNYLIPVDGRLASDRDIEDEAVSLSRVMAATDGAKKLRLVILDACRDNPFVAKMNRSYASRSVGRGLARIEPDTGSLVVYSARDGQVALDGDGAHSPFATALLRNIVKPNIEIGKLFRLVRDDVLTDTQRKQEPFVYGSLPGEDFFFVTNR